MKMQEKDRQRIEQGLRACNLSAFNDLMIEMAWGRLDVQEVMQYATSLLHHMPVEVQEYWWGACDDPMCVDAQACEAERSTRGRESLA